MKYLLTAPKFLFWLLFCLWVGKLGAQSTGPVDVSQVVSVKFLAREGLSLVPTDHFPSPLSMAPRQLDRFGNIRFSDVSKKILYRFSVYNSGDSVKKIYFFPGFFFHHTNLYKLNGGESHILKPEPVDTRDAEAIHGILVAPGDTMQLLAEIFQVKTYSNKFNPRLIHPEHLQGHLGQLHNSMPQETVITYIFCGLLMMMILFSLATYFQGKDREFLYYALYALLIGFMLFTKAHYFLRSNETTFFFESYFDFILQCLGICFYMAFMSLFLRARENYPFLYQLYRYGIIFLLFSIPVYTWLHYSTEAFTWQNLAENYIIKGFLLLLVVIFLVYAMQHWKNRLLRYLFWGNFLYLVFSLFSLVIILDQGLRMWLPEGFNSALLYYEIGLFLELGFFLMGLTYKNRVRIIEQTKDRERLRMENHRKEWEKQVAVMAAHQEERNRISADMHDELGSGMTTIRLMSEIARNKMKEQAPLELEKISDSANDLLNRMNAIIWSMNSGNDQVASLVSYIRAYSFEYLDNANIECVVNIPAYIPEMEITGDKRRNIFLCVKETLNNILKHSSASRVVIDIEVDENLVVTITDNGRGFDPAGLSEFGNGLKNMKKRMADIGGSFQLTSQSGTSTRLELPLNQSAAGS